MTIKNLIEPNIPPSIEDQEAAILATTGINGLHHVRQDKRTVAALGNSMGYGRLMDFAQQEWRRNGDAGTEFALGPCVVGTVFCGCRYEETPSSSCDWCCGAGWLTRHVREVQIEQQHHVVDLRAKVLAEAKAEVKTLSSHQTKGKSFERAASTSPYPRLVPYVTKRRMPDDADAFRKRTLADVDPNKQLTLGELFDYLTTKDQKRIVVGGFGEGSTYRGYNDQIAFVPVRETTAGAMLKHAFKAFEVNLQGKSSHPTPVTRDTLVNIAEWNDCGDNDSITRSRLETMFND